MRVLPHLLGVTLLFTLSGCGIAIPLAVVFLGDSDDGGAAPTAATPVVPEAVSFSGSFVPLPGLPADVVLGHFVGDDDHLDAAVISTDSSAVTILENDGGGKFSEHSRVALSPEALIPIALAALQEPHVRESDVLLVATSATLEVLVEDEEAGRYAVADSIAPAFELELRDMAVGDFNGDRVPDVALSSQTGPVEIFFGSRAASGAVPRFTRGGVLQMSAPQAIAASDFDGAGLSDLAVLDLVGLRDPILKLLVSHGDGSFTEVDQLREGDAAVGDSACLDARDDAVFVDCDPDPEQDECQSGRIDRPGILMCRQRSTAKIAVREVEGQLALQPHTRPTGTIHRRPADAALIRLPRSPEAAEAAEGCLLWDVVAVDAVVGLLQIAYSKKNGLGTDSRRNYAVPGRGRALAVGDLNGDAQDDVVVVSVAPAVLSVFLARPPGPDVEDDPLLQPAGRPFGEAAVTLGELDALLAGGGGPAGPFLVTLREELDEVVVAFPEGEPLDQATAWRLERYPLPLTSRGQPVQSLLVADLDRSGGDDIIAAFEDGQLGVLWHDGAEEGRTFLYEAEVLDLVTHPQCPGDLAAAALDRVSIALAALLGDGDYPDLVITVASDGLPEDYVVIVRDLGLGRPRDPASVELDFLLTLNDPRHATLGNVDGHPLDLLVACEVSNKIHILYGKEAEPGSFWDAEDQQRLCLPYATVPVLGSPGTPREMERNAEPEPPCRTPVIDGFEARGDPCLDIGEVEFLVTSNEATGSFEEPLEWILVSNRESVSVHNREVDSESFAIPCELYQGSDPEMTAFGDLDGDGVPELVVADEDQEQIVIYSEDKAGNPGACHPWTRTRTLPVPGSATAILLFEWRDGRAGIAATTSVDEIRFFTSAEFNSRFSVPVGSGNEPGIAAGLALFSPREGAVLIGSVVEDGDQQTGQPFAEFVEIVGDPDVSRDSAGTGRVDFESGRWVDAILLGRFIDDPEPVDLLAHDRWSGEIHCLPDFREAEGELEVVVVDRLPEGAPLAGWELVTSSDAEPLVLAGAGDEALLADATASERTWFYRTADGVGIRWLSHGYFGADRRAGDLYVLVLDRGGALRAIMPASGEESVVAQEAAGIAGAHDLDGEPGDEAVLAGGSALRIFMATGTGFVERTPRVPIVGGGELTDLVFLDANSDGLTDVCVANREGELFILFGDGTGDFPVQTTAFAAPGLEGLGTADVDLDGSAEIYAAVRTPGLVVLTADRDG